MNYQIGKKAIQKLKRKKKTNYKGSNWKKI